jgi:putative ABC transport system permease protein
MNKSVEIINFTQLSIALIPVLIVILIFMRWSLSIKQPIYALLRMFSQLLLIGYALSFIFDSQNSGFILLILCFMCITSSWIALGTVAEYRVRFYKYTLAAISLGGGVTLLLITQGTLQLSPWYEPHYMVPIAGMIFANAMNSVSLAAERLHAELLHHDTFIQARDIAFQAAMIPILNSLFAVGLVSLPGMMTGQILSGTSPFIAARYQIMVMAMIFASSGLSTAIYLIFVKSFYSRENNYEL